MDRDSHLDARIAALADRQHGPVTHEQLLDLGLSAEGIEARRRRGALHPIHRGVYAVGSSVLPIDGKRMAAVLACGEGAALSHASGAELHRVRPDSSARWHVTIPDRSGRDRPGIVIHRPRRLPADEVTAVRGIPVTTVARTILDMSATLAERQITRMCDEAERQGLVDWVDVLILLDRHRRHRGRTRLRRVLAGNGIGADRARSGLEQRFHEICARHGLPAPAINTVVEGYEVDVCWEARRLIVEVDHDEWHRTRFRREADKRKDLALTLAGWRVVRVTEAQILFEADALGAQIVALYAAGA